MTPIVRSFGSGATLLGVTFVSNRPAYASIRRGAVYTSYDWSFSQLRDWSWVADLAPAGTVSTMSLLDPNHSSSPAPVYNGDLLDAGLSPGRGRFRDIAGRVHVADRCCGTCQFSPAERTRLVEDQLTDLVDNADNTGQPLACAATAGLPVERICYGYFTRSNSVDLRLARLGGALDFDPPPASC